MRDLSGIDPRDGLGTELDVTWALCQQGLMGLLLGALWALPPITKPSAGAPPAAPPAGVPPPSLPSALPYQGYRSDLVAGEFWCWPHWCWPLWCWPL